MFKSEKRTIFGAVIAVIVFLSGGGLVIALDTDQDVSMTAVEKRLVRACQQRAISRSFHGQREMKIISYNLESDDVSIVKGSLRTPFRPGHWSLVNWTCRVHPKSGEIFQVAFDWPSSQGRMLAAASGLR